MKKDFKTFKLLLIALMLMLSSGCVKYNVTMDIKKDKSMDFNMIAAFDESFDENGEMNITEAKDEVKNQYCSVSDYNESNMKGINVSCKFPNIDELSSETTVKEADFESIMDDKDSKLFTLKKGFFKNTYTFKLDSSSSSDLLGDKEDEDSYDYREEDDSDYDDYDYDSDYDDYDYDSDLSDYSDGSDNTDFDMSALSSMDLKFEVKLPYKAISSNATSKEDNEKHLTWDLMKMAQSEDGNNVVELTFALYNTSNIAIVAVIVIALIAVGVIFFMKNKKKNVTGVTNMNTNNGMVNPANVPQDMFGNNFPINNTGVTVMPTEANNNMNNVNSMNSTNNMSNMNMGTSTGFNNDVTIDNAVNTNTVMPSTGSSVEVPVTSVQSEGVNNGVEPASLTNVPNPVNDVSKNDDLI